MTGKYNHPLKYLIALAYRSVIRAIVRTLIAWDKKDKPLENGCTVIIGMCSRLPGVLYGNLLGLRRALWPDLKEIIIVVDKTREPAAVSFEEQILNDFKHLNIRFMYYTPFQSRVAEFLKLPYIYSWLSWSIAINACRTKSFFIHDYDALILGDFLKERYATFVANNRTIQGVLYYQVNGIVPADKMVCTFEAFVNTQWVKSYAPVHMFNKLGFIHGRSVDFDTLLFMQQHYTQESQRAILPMSEDELLHPTQMIHQYTVFKKFPGRPWNCAALVMIPFFLSLQRLSILGEAAGRIRASKNKVIDLLADGCQMNFSTLQSQDLNKMLRLMVQGYVKFGIGPFDDFYQYGTAFYDLIALPEAQRWNIGETQAQKDWVEELKFTLRGN